VKQKKKPSAKSLPKVYSRRSLKNIYYGVSTALLEKSYSIPISKQDHIHDTLQLKFLEK